MFFIYSFSLDDLAVKLYDFCRTKDSISDLLDTIARNFIRHEEGERCAEAPYYDEVAEDQLTTDGYFLRHSSEKPNQIDVYLRKTQVTVGRVWNSYEVNCKKVMHFAVTEASLGLPIECTGKGVITQTFNTAMEAQQQVDHLAALKERLVEQRMKVDQQIKERDYQQDIVVPATPDSETDDEELENPVIRLKRRIATVEPEPLVNLDDILEQPEQPEPEQHSSALDDLNELLDELNNFNIPIPPPLPPVLMSKDYRSGRWGCPHEDYESESESESESTFEDSYDSSLSSDSEYSDPDFQDSDYSSE